MTTGLSRRSDLPPLRRLRKSERGRHALQGGIEVSSVVTRVTPPPRAAPEPGPVLRFRPSERHERVRRVARTSRLGDLLDVRAEPLPLRGTAPPVIVLAFQ